MLVFYRRIGYIIILQYYLDGRGKTSHGMSQHATTTRRNKAETPQCPLQCIKLLKNKTNVKYIPFEFNAK